MVRVAQANLAMVRLVAERLGDLQERVVFLGGAATALLITDAAAPDVRATLDVDVIVEIGTGPDYYRLGESLRAIGFTEDASEGAPLCRWLIDGIRVDIMPTDERILGFSNRWYLPALHHAARIEIDGGMTIRSDTAPFFLATKLEAFFGRGRDDFMASHDLEDLIAVLDGRKEIVEEVGSAPEDVREFLARSFDGLLRRRDFLDALPGHLPPDPASQQRATVVLGRTREIARFG
jgi:predicted nucleotidyltransferase